MRSCHMQCDMRRLMTQARCSAYYVQLGSCNWGRSYVCTASRITVTVLYVLESRGISAPCRRAISCPDDDFGSYSTIYRYWKTVEYRTYKYLPCRARGGRNSPPARGLRSSTPTKC